MKKELTKTIQKTKQRKKTSVYLILCSIYPGKKHNLAKSQRGNETQPHLRQRLMHITSDNEKKYDCIDRHK